VRVRAWQDCAVRIGAGLPARGGRLPETSARPIACGGDLSVLTLEQNWQGGGSIQIGRGPGVRWFVSIDRTLGKRPMPGIDSG